MDRRERLIARARQGFRLAYGAEPTRFYAAPGRVNLMGEHVDYNEGYVLPCAIDRDTIVALGPADKDARAPVLEAVAIDMGSARDSIALDQPITRGANNWQNHLRGVVAAFGRYGHQLRPARLAIAGDVPIGAGLSSSSAFGVAIALACSDYSGLALAPERLALVAQSAEHDFVGSFCGIMDPMAAALSSAGHALLLDCRSLQHMPIPIHRRLVVSVIDTGLRREEAHAILPARRAECAAAAEHFGVKALRDLDPDALAAGAPGCDPVLLARARHVVGEIARIEPVAVALVQGDAAALAGLMAEAHRSLAQDFAVSREPIDRLVGLIAAALGDAGGVRLSGAGLGGCLVAVTGKDAVTAIDDALAHYNRSADLPARAETYRPSAGAAPIRSA